MDKNAGFIGLTPFWFWICWPKLDNIVGLLTYGFLKFGPNLIIMLTFDNYSVGAHSGAATVDPPRPTRQLGPTDWVCAWVSVSLVTFFKSWIQIGLICWANRPPPEDFLHFSAQFYSLFKALFCNVWKKSSRWKQNQNISAISRWAPSLGGTYYWRLHNGLHSSLLHLHVHQTPLLKNSLVCIQLYLLTKQPASTSGCDVIECEAVCAPFAHHCAVHDSACRDCHERAFGWNTSSFMDQLEHSRWGNSTFGACSYECLHFCYERRRNTKWFLADF